MGVLCVNASGVPTWPDAAPQVEFYGPSGKIAALARSVPALERSFTTGMFQSGLFVNEMFPTGPMRLVFRWQISGVFLAKADTFEVIAGGNPHGYVLALDSYVSPQGQFLVQQLSSGRIRAGQNPRL